MYDNPPIPNIPIIRKIISYLAYRKICKIVPIINEWIDELIAETSDQAIPVWERGFYRLSEYYAKDLLKKIRVVYTNRCPIPPLKKFGINALAGYEAWNPEGIPYKNIFFVRSHLYHWDVVHFHEMVHAIQWRELGDDEYIRQYAHGILLYGYKNSPLEKMAWENQYKYEKDREPFDVERVVIKQLKMGN